MKKIRFGLSQKILLGFFIILVVFTINTLATLLTLYTSTRIVEENRQVINPTLYNLDRFSMMVSNSKMYTTNWVYLQTNKQDKQALRQLHAVDYPALKDELTNLMQYWEDPRLKAEMDSNFHLFEKLLKVQKNVMETLVSFEDYEDATKKFIAMEMIDSKILPMSTRLTKRLDEVSEEKRKERDNADKELTGSFNTLEFTIYLLGSLVIVLGLVIGLITSRSISRPLNHISKIIDQLSKGKLPENDTWRYRNDEIGDMGQAVRRLVAGLKETSNFAEKIGKGELKAQYEPLSQEDVLGNSLLHMRENLTHVADQDRKRNWATEGVAKFSDILRRNNNNLNKLAEEIIFNLVKYIDATQGSLFIIDDESKEEEKSMQLAACYAWDRHKFLDQTVYRGEGLVGQAWLEGDTIYVTEVPDNYISITSGLGESNPKAIMIVPLKVNDEIFGVVELAGFETFEDYQIEFVEKIGESIASTVSMVKINERTGLLLEESQEMTEQMRAQEEEMRQNMEELQATQEEMERTQRVVQKREDILNNTSLTIELDDQFRINSFNHKVLQDLSYRPDELEGVDFSTLIVNTGEVDLVKSAFYGKKQWAGMLTLKGARGTVHKVKTSAGPLTDTGELRYWLIMADVTDYVTG